MSELEKIANLLNTLFYVMLYLAREFAQNKKEEHLSLQVNIASHKFGTLYQC